MAKRKKVTRKRKKKVVRKVGVMTPERALTMHVKSLVKKYHEIMPHGYSVRKAKRRKKR